VSDLLTALREAFDGDDVPRKNIMLRTAYDRIADLEAAAQGRFREEWRADVGNPFFEAAKAAADERMAALKHESRSHLMRAEASERQLADMRAALQEIADSDIRYPPHDPGNYMPPKGYDGPCRKIALAALSRASDSIPERS
jgi:hypothetical protein